MNDELFLEIGSGHNLWALESELADYVEQLQDRPRGHCLEIGLGLGVASKYILSFPKVDSLTTVEINKDVIAVQQQANPVVDKWGYYSTDHHVVLNCDGLEFMYVTKNTYDFIFIDCYSEISEDTLPIIQDMVQAGKNILKPGGTIMGWFDPYTPDDFVDRFYNLFK